MSIPRASSRIILKFNNSSVPGVSPLIDFSIQYNRKRAPLGTLSTQESFRATSVVAYSVSSFAHVRYLGLSFHFRRRILRFDPAQLLRGVPLCCPASLCALLCRSSWRQRFFPPVLLPNLRIPGTPETQAQPAAGAANATAPGSKNPSEDDKGRAALKERVALKEKIKDAQSDLELLQREYQLDQDSIYSSPDYTKNTSGKEKLAALKQRISDKQQELDQLKARLAVMPEPQEGAATTPKP